MTVQSMDEEILTSAGTLLATELALAGDDVEKYGRLFEEARATYGNNFYSLVLPIAMLHMTSSILSPCLEAVDRSRNPAHSGLSRSVLRQHRDQMKKEIEKYGHIVSTGFIG